MNLSSDSTNDQAPADPAATDDVLAHQPTGHWSGRVHEAVTRHLRDAMAGIDVTQPQYWVLNRVNGGPAASSVEEVIAQLAPLAGGRHEISRTVDQLLHRGWLRTDAAGNLHLTETGEAARSRLRELATELRAEVHRGIDDEEYVAALTGTAGRTPVISIMVTSRPGARPRPSGRRRPRSRRARPRPGPARPRPPTGPVHSSR